MRGLCLQDYVPKITGTFVVFVSLFLARRLSLLLSDTDWQSSQDIIEVVWSPANASRTHFVFNRQYEVAMFHWVGANWSQAAANESLGMVTMMGLDKLDHLASLAQQWPGLVSASVFVPGSDFHLVAVFLYYLELCHGPALANWSIHLVFPSEHPPRTMSHVVFPRSSISCQHSPSDLVGSLVPFRPPSNIASTIPFPQNVMRNVAKSGCPSPFITFLDGDMLPNAEFYGDVQPFLKRPAIQACAKCVYILPVFEVPSGWPLSEQPKNKTDLIEAITQGNAHPFYFEVLPKANRATDYLKWVQLPIRPGIRRAYPLANYEFFYEPIFIAPESAPNFDDHFIGYGLNRNTQIYEMFLAGYTFHIVDNGFVLHQGYKETASMYPEWKLEQYKVNNERFKDFLREITAKYQQDPCQMLDQIHKDSPNFPDDVECSVSLGSSQSLSEDFIDILSPSEKDQ